MCWRAHFGHRKARLGSKKMSKPVPVVLLALSLGLLILCRAEQGTYLHHYLKSRRSRGDSFSSEYVGNGESPVYLLNQDGQMDADRIDRLPGQPDGVDFQQYAGYVTVNPEAGRALFYYFAESPANSSTNPLVLWLNGGPGCSSFGYGAMEELGPFRVDNDGKTLYRNPYSWNNVANVIFLESPAGVGFSYSNTTSDYNNTGDTSTANDAYNFLVNWLERFPQYKTRDFYITGESYAGHYVPQLANTILLKNQNSQTVINLKGIAIGNALVDDKTMVRGYYDHLWTHALNSDETHAAIYKYCNLANNTSSDQCDSAAVTSVNEMGNIDIDNMYAPVCPNPVPKNGATGSVDSFDPCSDAYVDSYLNTAEVQSALHVKTTTWRVCRIFNYWNDWQSEVLPTIQNIVASGTRVWLYSGDIDANVPVTSTRYGINTLKLPVEAAWRAWYHENEVGGYVVGYKGLTFVTVRGAGHLVPSYQPQRALTMILSFLQGVSPPSS